MANIRSPFLMPLIRLIPLIRLVWLIRPPLLRSLLLSVVLASTPFLGSCGSEKADPFVPSQPALGGLTVNANVEDGGVVGVQVGITGPETMTGTTDASGKALFSPITPGSYTVEITSAPDTIEFIRTSRTVLVPSGGLASVSFMGTVKAGS